MKLKILTLESVCWQTCPRQTGKVIRDGGSNNYVGPTHLTAITYFGSHPVPPSKYPDIKYPVLF